jgi:hypothetical protein
MSFSHLAAVELQSVMHYLEAPVLLALARCSRFTLQCASSSFAWRHALVRLACKSHEVAALSAHPYNDMPHSLIRFCGRISLRVDSSSRKWMPSSEEELDAIASFPHLRALDLSAADIEHDLDRVDGDAELTRCDFLLTRLPLDSLTELRTGLGSIVLDMDGLISRQTRLRSLRSAVPANGAVNYFENIFKLDQLTTLHVDTENGRKQCFRSLIRCPASLTSFQARCPHVKDWQYVLGGSMQQSLTSLSLDEVDGVGGSMQEWDAVFRGMQLVNVTVSSCIYSDIMTTSMLSHSISGRLRGNVMEGIRFTAPLLRAPPSLQRLYLHHMDLSAEQLTSVLLFFTNLKELTVHKSSNPPDILRALLDNSHSLTALYFGAELLHFCTQADPGSVSLRDELHAKMPTLHILPMPPLCYGETDLDY